MRLILPILLVVLGLGGGVGAGLYLRPDPAEEKHMAQDAVECVPVDTEKDLKAPDPSELSAASEFVKLNNQFVVPIVADQRVSAMVIMSLTLEVPPGQVEAIYAREPKLRDAFLQTMFDHANIGGFNGAFTDSSTLDVLRRSLHESSYHVVGDLVIDVLITEIARQDV